MSRTAKQLHERNHGPFEGNASNKHFWKMSDPPRNKEAGGFLWFTQEMLISPAWASLTGHGMRLVMRLVVEHLSHRRMKNGELIVTYSDFIAYGIPPKAISAAIANAVASGFVSVSRGRRSYGARQLPNLYTLTWLPTCDGGEPTNRWKAFDTAQKIFSPPPKREVGETPEMAEIRQSADCPNGKSARTPNGKSVKGQNRRKQPISPTTQMGSAIHIMPGGGDTAAAAEPSGFILHRDTFAVVADNVPPPALLSPPEERMPGGFFIASKPSSKKLGLARLEKSRSARRGAAA